MRKTIGQISAIINTNMLIRCFRILKIYEYAIIETELDNNSAKISKIKNFEKLITIIKMVM
ncbi:MAG: hypothetical protein RR033_02105 [Clostridia bacterium]